MGSIQYIVEIKYFIGTNIYIYIYIYIQTVGHQHLSKSLSFLSQMIAYAYAHIQPLAV